jgi:hypothetical protein
MRTHQKRPVLSKKGSRVKTVELRQWLVAACGLGIVMLVFACSNPVNKKDAKPLLSMVSDTTVSVKDSIVLHVFNIAGSGKAVNYIWSLDSRRLISVPAPDSMCHLFFGIQDTGVHIVSVIGLSQGNTESEPETTKVLVLLNPPVVHCLTKDTTISANDSVHIVATGSDPNGSVIAYHWLIDTGTVAVFSVSETLSCWFGAQSGIHCVRVSAMDDDSIMSAMDSVHIRVAVNPPQINVLHDTTIPINDTLVIHAVRLDTFSTTIRWVWAENGIAFSDTTNTGSLLVRFARNEAGDRRVLVKAIDSHQIESNVDSVHVKVVLDPPRVAIVHDTIVPINDPAVLHARGTDTNGYIVKYVWALDGTNFADTTAGDSIAHVYSRADTGKNIVVLVKAFDDDTLVSNVDSVHIVVRLKPSPSVSITADTSVFINDTFNIAAKGVESSSNSPVVEYVWAVDKPLFGDTTKASLKPLSFGRLGAGRHVVRVKAVDRDTMESLAESLVVQVRLGTPVVVAMKDTAVFINDTAFLHASGMDTNGTVVRYIWSFDGGPFTDTTTAGAARKVWAKQEAGLHVIRVIGIDDDTISSAPAPCTVSVRLGTPVIQTVHDTAVPWGTTVAVVISANDTNGTIVEYLEDSAGTGTWSDSSTHDTLRFTSNMHCRKIAVVGVRDDDGLVAKDTFYIDFKSVACSLTVQGPKIADTVLVNSFVSKKVNTAFSLSAFRSDGKADTFTYSFLSGLSPSTLVETYRGNNAACTLKTLDSGTYYWKSMAFDGHNDTVSTPVFALCVLFQRRICFVGHSIITGMGSANGHGGMRRMIIDTLRAKAGLSRRIGCEGPLTTPVSYSVLPAVDDSCLAVGGNTCAAIYDSMRIYGSNNADIWVYMNGVNDWYTFPTYDPKYYAWGNYAVISIDSMHARNPNSEIYVFNGLPFPADTGAGFTSTLDSAFTKYLPVFNHMLDSVVTARRQTWQANGQGGIWLVDAFTPMSLPDSHCNPAYFTDFLHPNQQGYDLMAQQLFKVMRAANSSFIK